MSEQRLQVEVESVGADGGDVGAPMIHVSVASARLQAACGSSLSQSEGPSQYVVLESMVWSHVCYIMTRMEARR